MVFFIEELKYVQQNLNYFQDKGVVRCKKYISKLHLKTMKFRIW